MSMYVCAYVCACVCVCACMYVSVCVYVCVSQVINVRSFTLLDKINTNTMQTITTKPVPSFITLQYGKNTWSDSLHVVLPYHSGEGFVWHGNQL